MRLTVAMLEAICAVGGAVGAGAVEDVFGQDTPENSRYVENFMKVKQWAHEQIHKREARVERKEG